MGAASLPNRLPSCACCPSHTQPCSSLRCYPTVAEHVRSPFTCIGPQPLIPPQFPPPHSQPTHAPPHQAPSLRPLLLQWTVSGFAALTPPTGVPVESGVFGPNQSWCVGPLDPAPCLHFHTPLLCAYGARQRFWGWCGVCGGGGGHLHLAWTGQPVPPDKWITPL